MITDQMVEAGAEVAYLRNREGSIAWAELSTQHKSEWRERVRPVITAALAKVKCATVEYDHSNIAGHIYYVKLADAKPPPYLVQRRVEAILDIAEDGTLAGIDLIDDMPPPPATPEASKE